MLTRNCYMRKKDIAAKYGIPHNTLSTIVKNREKIESLTSSDLQLERKRQRKCGSADVDRALFIWIKQALKKNVKKGKLMDRKSPQTPVSRKKESREATSLKNSVVF